MTDTPYDEYAGLNDGGYLPVQTAGYYHCHLAQYWALYNVDTLDPVLDQAWDVYRIEVEGV